MRITKETHIREALEKCPGAAQIFDRHGLDCAACFGADVETIEDGALMHDIDLGALLEDLNRACGQDG